MACSRSILAIVLGSSLVSLAGCGQQSQPISDLLDPEGNFTLYVSNQSFAIDLVDVKISIDKQTVVDQDFYVGNQHSWQVFQLSLIPGKHTLRAKSRKGKVRLERTFDVKGRHWAAVGFSYYPQTHYEPTPRKFTFYISNKPIGFN